MATVKRWSVGVIGFHMEKGGLELGLNERGFGQLIKHMIVVNVIENIALTERSGRIGFMWLTKKLEESFFVVVFSHGIYRTFQSFIMSAMPCIIYGIFIYIEQLWFN